MSIDKSKVKDLMEIDGIDEADAEAIISAANDLDA